MADKEGAEDELKKLLSNKKGNSALPIQQSLATITDYWKEGKRPELDAQATEIADGKEARVASRKKLTEVTKEFRKQTDEEKLKGFGALLKHYQEEIDTLTKRSKFSDNAFLGVYKFLAEAPDPVLGLNAVQSDISSSNITRIAELEMENKKYKTELEEFRKDFGEIKNQEVTIRRLEDKITGYEAKIDSIVEERIKASEELLNSESNKSFSLFKEKESELQRQLTHALQELSRSQHALEVSQSELMEIRSKNDEGQVAKQSEYEMLVDELERSRSRVLLLEREREKLLDTTSNPNNNGNTGNRISSTDLELELAQKEIEYSHLKESMLKYENTCTLEINNLKSELSTIQHQLSNERNRAQLLETQLANNPTSSDYQEIKTQLDVLKRTFEYNDSEPLDASSVEKLLKEKCKKLETEIVQLKATMSEKTKNLEESNAKIITLEKTTLEMKGLISKLEEDISINSSNTQVEEDVFSPNTVAPSPKVSRVSSNANLGKDDSSMLQIVINQRDRYKQKIIELEAQNKELYQQRDYKNNELSSLRNDNIKLYEKIKYLQSYGNSSSTRRDIESNKRDDDDDIDSKYSKLYEDTVNPFVIFNRKEKYRKYKELNPAEKVILNSSTFFLSSKGTRLFLFFYSVTLHLLVFATLYKLAHSRCNIPLD